MPDRVYIYQTSANQKTIHTRKTQSNAAHLYGIMNIDAVLTSARNLSDRAYKLYIRMMLHQDGYTYALSPVEINRSIGMSDKRYRDAVKELIDKGYLVQSTEHKNLYTIYEYPEKDNPVFQNRTDNPSILDRCPVENGHTPRPFWTDNPSISEGEIVHNITPNNTVHSTVNSTSIMGENDYQNINIENILDDLSDVLSFKAGELPRTEYVDDGDLPF